MQNTNQIIVEKVMKTASKPTFLGGFWFKCNYRTWKSFGISIVYRPSAKGFIMRYKDLVNVTLDVRFYLFYTRV